jgi:hypothetical protein
MNISFDIVNDLKGNSVSTDNNSKEPSEKSQSEDESETNEWDRADPEEKEHQLHCWKYFSPRSKFGTKNPKLGSNNPFELSVNFKNHLDLGCQFLD